MELSIFKSSNYQAETSSFFASGELICNRADLTSLGKILEVFQKLPYENVSKLIRWHENQGKQLSMLRLPDVLWDDFQRYQMGGTCYSLTYFLETILENSGYNCYPVSCDMKWGSNVHCCLVVLINNELWLCDPGYLLTTPMRLMHTEQKIYRSETSGVVVNWDGSRYHLSTFRGNDIKWRYSFSDQACSRSKFVEYWLRSFGMPGMNGLCLTRQEKGNMVYIHNNFIKQVDKHKINKQRVSGDWLSEIEKHFSIPRKYLNEAYSITRERRDK